MFALAVGNFSAVSQTFVWQHAQKIAPKRSVFVSHQSFDDPDLPGPHLFALKKTPRVSRTDFTLGPLSVLSPRTRVITQFLLAHGVTTMMAEFGTYAVKVFPAAQAAGCAFYVHFHGWDASSALRDRKFVRKYKKLFVEANGFFAPSQFIADKMIAIGCPADKIAITPCGVEPEEFPFSVGEPKRCLAVGRFVGKKAPGATVEAFAMAAKNHPDARLDFVGSGPLLGPTKKRAEELGIAAQVNFHGEQPHHFVKSLMKDASIFLQHSVTAKDGNVEGLPVAVLEAMSSGLAVVATRHSGIPEAVIEGETGYLVEEHDIPTMAERLGRLFSDQELTQGFGNRGNKRALECFTVDRSIKILRARMNI